MLQEVRLGEGSTVAWLTDAELGLHLLEFTHSLAKEEPHEVSREG